MMKRIDKLLCLLLILTMLPICGLTALASNTLTVTTSSLPAGSVDKAYNSSLTASGTDNVTWTVSAGRLPDGLRLNMITGAITGSPKLTGVYSFAVTASDSSFNRASKELNIAVDAKDTDAGQSGGRQTQSPNQPDQPEPTDSRKPLPEYCIWSLDGSAAYRKDLGDGVYEDFSIELQFVNMDSHSPAGDYIGSIYSEMTVDASEYIENISKWFPAGTTFDMHFDLEAYALSQGVVIGVQNYYTYKQTNFWPTVQTGDGHEITPVSEEYVCLHEGVLVYDSRLQTGASYDAGTQWGSVGDFDIRGTGPCDVKFYFVIEPDSVWGDDYYYSSTGKRNVKIYVCIEGDWFTGSGTLTRQPGGMDNRTKWSQFPPETLAHKHGDVKQTGDTLQDQAGADQKVIDMRNPDDQPLPSTPVTPPTTPPKSGEPGHKNYPLSVLTAEDADEFLAPLIPANPTPWNDSKSSGLPLGPL